MSGNARRIMLATMQRNRRSTPMQIETRLKESNMSTERSFKIPEGREEEAGGGIEFIRASALAEEGVTGAILEGTFLEATPNQLNNTRLDYTFEKEDGSRVVVNGAGNLGYKMKFISPGEYVQIQYLGKQEIKKGAQAGRMSHNFEVLTAE